MSWNIIFRNQPETSFSDLNLAWSLTNVYASKWKRFTGRFSIFGFCCSPELS